MENSTQNITKELAKLFAFGELLKNLDENSDVSNFALNTIGAELVNINDSIANFLENL